MNTTVKRQNHAIPALSLAAATIVGLAVASAAPAAAASAHAMVAMGVFLFLGGMAAASAVTASGRLVTGWFPPRQRAVAMGIRRRSRCVDCFHWRRCRSCR
jgi:sugar phosphate permease